jgi:hypothetical protein
MPTLTEEQINEIADQLDCGFRSFWHRHTGKLIYLPDFENNPYAESEFYKKDLEELASNNSNYIEIEKPQSGDSFKIMVKFAEKLENNVLRQHLVQALNSKKPFKEFKYLIDTSGVHRQEWFDFKNSQLKNWVRARFDEANNNNTENGST